MMIMMLITIEMIFIDQFDQGCHICYDDYIDFDYDYDAETDYDDSDDYLNRCTLPMGVLVP